jgi:tetratricopeptide (TPR) repeat protein
MMSSAIEEHIAKNDWDAARLLIQAQLDKEPEDPHWLLTRLGLTHYEQYNYERALELEEQAFALAPDCPLVLWDYAGTLEMLDRPTEALVIYQRIIGRGVASLAYDKCGEGRARARALFVDSLYRMSHCFTAIGDHAKAVETMGKHLEQRGPGCQSIYPIAQVRKEQRALQAGS